MDLEQTAIERLRMASDMSLRLYKQPLVITYSGGKDSDVMLHLAGAAGIPYEVLHSLTTADAPETVYHVRDTFRRLELAGVKCDIDTHKQPNGKNMTMWRLIPYEADTADAADTLLLRGTQRDQRARAMDSHGRALGGVKQAQVQRHYGDDTPG